MVVGKFFLSDDLFAFILDYFVGSNRSSLSYSAPLALMPVYIHFFLFENGMQIDDD